MPLNPAGEPQSTGDPLEFAIAQAARAASVDTRAADGTMPEFVDEIPFDAARRRMTRVWRHGGRRTAYVKGAPEAVLERATLDRDKRLAVARQAEEWAGEGLRVLAIARRGLADDAVVTTDTLEDCLDPVGLIAFRDPLRAASQQAGVATLAEMVAEPDFWTMASAWEDLMAGQPRAGSVAYRWTTGHAETDDAD